MKKILVVLVLILAFAFIGCQAGIQYGPESIVPAPEDRCDEGYEYVGYEYEYDSMYGHGICMIATTEEITTTLPPATTTTTTNIGGLSDNEEEMIRVLRLYFSDTELVIVRGELDFLEDMLDNIGSSEDLLQAINDYGEYCYENPYIGFEEWFSTIYQEVQP